MGEIIDFATERSIRRPNEPSFELQQKLNLCSTDVDYESVFDRESGQDYRTFYLQDLGKRMLTSFIKLGGKLPRPIMKEFDRLGTDDQDEVQATIDKFKELKGR